MRLSTGEARGEVLSDGVRRWCGIPFAAPPVGELRFRRPRPPAPWEGELDCTDAREGRRASPVQAVYPGQDLGPGGHVDEDCLVANVWAPPAGAPPAPVMVWAYGGALLHGSCMSARVSLAAYAREHGAVGVNFNYRVGALGFLCVDGGDANCGLWDAVRALQWVRTEAARFGGDPLRVTLFGHSAGGDISFWLTASPLANRLFHRSIIMSAGCFAFSPPEAREVAAEFAERAGTTATGLRTLPTKALLKTQTSGQFSLSPCTGPGWRYLMRDPPPGNAAGEVTPAGLLRLAKPVQGWGLPVAVVDGDLLPAQPLDLLAGGSARHLAVVVGCAREEMGYAERGGGARAPACFGTKLKGATAAEQRRDAARRLAAELAGAPALVRAPGAELQRRAEALLAQYDADDEMRTAASERGFLGALGAEQWRWDNVLSDVSFGACSHLIAERLSAHSPRVWRYLFDGYGGKNGFHGWELGLMLGDPAPKAARAGRAAWLAANAAFARDGSPGPAWPAYAAPARRVLRWDGERRAPRVGSVAGRAGLLACAARWEEWWGLKAVGGSSAAPEARL